MLLMDPDCRISVESALAHPYLATYADPDDEVSLFLLFLDIFDLLYDCDFPCSRSMVIRFRITSINYLTAYTRSPLL